MHIDATYKFLQSKIERGWFQKIKGKHYDETYSPLVRWTTIRLILTLATLKKCKKQIDFVQSFPQAPIERYFYMRIPAVINVENGKNRDHKIKIHLKIYGQKQAGRVWFEYLVKIRRDLESRILELSFIKAVSDFTDLGLITILDQPNGL